MLKKSIQFAIKTRAYFSSLNGPSLLETYNNKVQHNKIRDDAHQRKIITSLDNLRTDLLRDHDAWVEYSKSLKTYSDKVHHIEEMSKPSTKKEEKVDNSGFFGSMFGQQPSAPTYVEPVKPNKPTMGGNKHKGLYIYGGPGCGKTYMMDMFYDTIPFPQKQRIHFNEFMLRVHDNLHKINTKIHPNPLALVANNVASKLRLLCFDEFQVTDIADAMIMKNLFENLFANNIVLVATSNRPPEDLYYRGLQRQLFLPFIDVLKRECDIINIKSPTDYRLTFENKEDLKLSTYLHPPNRQSSEKLDEIFKKLSGREQGTATKLTVMSGREIEVPNCANGVAMYNFNDLCDKPFGSMDFIALCRNFHTIILKNVPEISLNNRNLTRRFILLVDELYNHKVKLYVSAKLPLANLFEINVEDGVSDELFALDRCKSRLIEMQSQKYLEEPSYYELKAITSAGGHAGMEATAQAL